MNKTTIKHKYKIDQDVYVILLATSPVEISCVAKMSVFGFYISVDLASTSVNYTLISYNGSHAYNFPESKIYESPELAFAAIEEGK